MNIGSVIDIKICHISFTPICNLVPGRQEKRKKSLCLCSREIGRNSTSPEPSTRQKDNCLYTAHVRHPKNSRSQPASRTYRNVQRSTEYASISTEVTSLVISRHGAQMTHHVCILQQTRISENLAIYCTGMYWQDP